ncbi:MAG: SoxR reducing system RseC family protein [Desulfobacterales bacterium]|nr:SoxR reducing system RseC family protein [Desulfobacterales bacterium]
MRTDSEAAWVQTTRSSACHGCTAKNSCHSLSHGQNMEVKALNLAGARAGDRIVLSFETKSLLKATFLIYVFPIIFLVAGAVVGHLLASLIAVNPSGLSVVMGFSCFLAALLFMKTRANKMAAQNAYQPKITKIISHHIVE